MKPCPLCHSAPADLWEIPKGHSTKCDRASIGLCGQPAINVTPYWHNRRDHFHTLTCDDCHERDMKDYYRTALTA